ncbi:DNA polymerase III subunit delta [Tellurirhabdus rosea]|uniref:DNA polymerase III subunit delta n=1 Tax=Tellurirhabdus rosea TaxID=2674997 RepID=UPI00225B9B91|nr:DNA polymerase III subunit delta [Tellurirhabdus rosea]
MTPAIEQILKDIRKKKFSSVYLVHGDEPYYIEKIADEVESHAIPEAEKGFNQFVVFGKDTDVGAVLNMVRRYPFMAERQLVIVKEAQDLGGFRDKKQYELLLDYLRNPLPSTILLLCHKDSREDKRMVPAPILKAFDGKDAGGRVLVQSKKMYDDKVPNWIGDYCRAQGAKVSLKAIQMLMDNIGNDLKRLAGEIDKILLNLRPGEEITAETVERLVGISKEYNVFELQKALTQRDVVKANRIVAYFGRNPKDNPLPPMLSLLHQFFSKVLMVQASRDQSEKGLAGLLGVNPYFVKDYLMAARAYPLWKVAAIMASLRKADALSKGVNAPTLSEADILKQLVFEMLH